MEKTTKNKKTLTVGVSIIQPLVMETKGGKFNGFEIELWERVAKYLGRKFEYKKYKFKNLLDKVKEKKVDLAIAGITRNEEREKVVDFSYYTLDTGLGILVSGRGKVGLLGLIKSFFTREVKRLVFLVLGLFIFVFVFSHLLWFFERGIGAFAADYGTGIFESLWWVIVTVSTVGYGDYVPLTAMGRAFGIVVILSGYILYVIIIAEISSIMTIRRIKSNIQSTKDLHGKKVATLKHTVSVDALEKLKAKIVLVDKIEQAYKKLEFGKVDAVVFDAPTLHYYANHQGLGKVLVLDNIFQTQSYGIALPENSDLIENINRGLLNLHDTGEYQELHKKWFSEED
ncbi:transporter substrate-binding domain-containing protein [Candidatus Falkowbacteria bacterium]|jgi:polar amino acid transport system substrate-binding protein|nr:transporter substrate-binding domain-containing protein [Candidatus Falkowbacteria bacterium]MBT5502856.1 transporter substrate-binding domain-containing protein [Candidatus Falkowbacteria bacterium]MBT6574613.1 transporter substrate-binding domain-containing protein [Candidatus Falkowbacteria bacterium]MBT7348883.1 transporter substrate-binding domain-containing protein [Candidatus Falkowbacteria bacterium]MBT7501034.1 transporter substrate-binding domain-containing protein [Candidatus Falk